MRRMWLSAAAAAVAAAGGGVAVVAGGVAATPPNVILLMADQLRFDALGVSQQPGANLSTPRLDAIARNGVRFSAAYSTTPTCTPARSALLTGLSPWYHGMLGYGTVADRYPGGLALS